ncbi:S8 family peptidase [Paractinoplanes globisporus]|uniref:S8 family serine peptidase n=1 Tax=Paractinoplanes globisporus TaxID=113565 RepID=A0ABW6WNX0_9ACTN|nr:S8/S53 family peptidase [Actinoplanes globisporus]
MTRSTPGLDAEIDFILSTTGAAALPPHEPGSGQSPQLLYREGTILVREEDVDTVVNALPAPSPEGYDGSPGANEDGRSQLVVFPGLVRMTLLSTDGSAPDVVRALNRRVGSRMIDLDYLMVCASHPCPASEPVPVVDGEPVPPIAAAGGAFTGRGVVVSIVDSGLAPDYAQHHWLSVGVYGDRDQMIKDDRTIEHYGGHGTFVAGTVRAIAPRATLFVEGAVSIFNGEPTLVDNGAAFSSALSAQISQALAHRPDVMVMTFATETIDQRSPLCFDVLYEKQIQHIKGLAFLAPAANDSSQTPEFPAACSWVIGVGALNATGDQRADFSNYGRWVDVYAPGEGLVNALTTGHYTYLDPPGATADFTGLAEWSGTCFSTPIVAGLIAARMSSTEESGQQAARTLLECARAQRIPGVGPVLYPDQARCHIHCDCHRHRRCHTPPGGKEKDRHRCCDECAEC